MQAKKKSRHFYTSDEKNFIRKNVRGISLSELTKRFNDRFGLNISELAIGRQKWKYGLKSDFNSGRFTSEYSRGNKFRKGLKPANGFEKGHLPPRTKAIGTETVNKDNFIEVKIAQPNVWRLKHHIIYEKAYAEKIRPDEKIIFLDGNKRNFSIDNLMKLSQKEQILLAKNGIKSNDPEITKVCIGIIKMNARISDILNKNKEKYKIKKMKNESTRD